MIDLSHYLQENSCGIGEMLLESTSSPTSDNAIYYKIGEHKWLWVSKAPARRDSLMKKYHISGDHDRAGIIRFAKATTPKLLPDEQEIIHRDKWDLDGLIGETEYQLMHPHYWTLTSWILKSHKRKRDTLTIFECSNSKPYVISRQRKALYLDKYRAFTDCACIANPGIVPLEYSQFYPYRYDEWNHFAEKPDIVEKYMWVCAARFLAYIKKLGYKHVVVVEQTPYMQQWAQMLYDENIEGCKDWLHIVNNPQFEKRLIAKYKAKFGGSVGLVHNRCLGLPMFVERYQKLLKQTLPADQQKDFDELVKILDIESNTERKEKLAEFNKEHDVEEYEPEVGTTDTFKLLDIDEITSQEKVAGYEKYVKKFLNGLEKAYTEAKKDEKWHKHRVVFTVLDLLIDKNDNKLIDDPDTEYWNIWKAVHNLCDDNDDIKQLNSYCYCYKPLMDDLDKETVQKYCNKLGITAFWDDRRKSPDK